MRSSTSNSPAEATVESRGLADPARQPAGRRLQALAAGLALLLLTSTSVTISRAQEPQPEPAIRLFLPSVWLNTELSALAPPRVLPPVGQATPTAGGPATATNAATQPSTPAPTPSSTTPSPTLPPTPTLAPTPIIEVEGNRVRTPHYDLRVEGTDGREIGLLLEALHPQLSEHFGQAPEERLVGEIYANRTDYVAGLAADGIGDPGGGGYYEPRTRKFYLFVQPSEHFTRQLTIHEATHQFHYLAATDNRGASGGWYIEGLAEYFGMHVWDGQRLLTGTVPWVTLEDYPAQALERFDALGQDLAALIADRGNWARPPGWALVHFLMHTRPTEAMALFDRLNRRENPSEAWEAVFGPADEAWAADYRAWLIEHQQPGREIWRAFQQWGDAIEGKSGVNAMAVLKETPQRVAVEIEPVEGNLRAGLVFGYRAPNDFHLFQVLEDGQVWVIRYRDNQWIFLHMGRVAAPGPSGLHKLAVEQIAGGARLLANGVPVMELEVEGLVGLNVDGCKVLFHWR
jgi:hypothetical protein